MSMGWTGVRKLREVVANVRTCLAVEICCAAQGIDLRADIAAAEPARRRPCTPRCGRWCGMNVDREVAEQIAIVEELLPALVEVAGARCDGLR